MKKEKLQIKLSDIPDEGRDFTYSRGSGEFDLPLKDLIADQNYQIDFHIRPVGNVFELQGSVKTQMVRACSQCGYDLTIPLELELNEILISKAKEHRGDTAKKSHSSDEGTDEDSDLSVTFVSGGVLDAEEYVHEMVAFNEPAYPSCNLSDCEHLDEAKEKIDKLKREAEMALQTADQSPFAALKNLKLQ